MALQGLGSRRNTVYKPTHPSFARAFRLRSVWTPPHWLKQRLLIDVPSIRGVISVGFLRDNKNTYVIVPIFWEVAHGTAYISCFVVKCTALTIPWVVVEDRIVPLDLFFHLLLRFSRTKLRGLLSFVLGLLLGMRLWRFFVPRARNGHSPMCPDGEEIVCGKVLSPEGNDRSNGSEVLMCCLNRRGLNKDLRFKLWVWRTPVQYWMSRSRSQSSVYFRVNVFELKGEKDVQNTQDQQR